MRSRSQAPSAGSAPRATGSTATPGHKVRGLFGMACLCVLGLAAFLGSGAPVAGAVEPPTIGHVFVDQVTETTARLNAEIETHGEPTTYRFEYGTDTSYGTNVPVPDGEVLTPEATGDLTEHSKTITNVDVTQGHFLVGQTIEGAGIPSGVKIVAVGPNAIEMSIEAEATATGVALSSPTAAVSQTIEGLNPGTTYHYVLLANGAGASESSDHILHTYAEPSQAAETCLNGQFREEQHSTFLPDCRSYEMVSPSDKNGADVLVDASHVRASSDGDAAEFASLAAFGDARGNSMITEYISDRGQDGWLTHSITPPQDSLTSEETPNLRLEFRGTFSPDLEKGFFAAKTPLTEAPNVAKVNNLYLGEGLRQGAGSFTLLSDATTPQPPQGFLNFEKPTDAGASADFSHLIFESGRNLTADAVAAGLPEEKSTPKLYEWSEGSETLVGQVPPSGETECGASGPACEPGVSEAGGGALKEQYTERTISADGSRVIFTAPPLGESGTAGRLYLRDDHGTGSSADDTTVQINASELASPKPEQPARFWTASADASQVFFTTPEQLTEDDHNSQSDLYRYDLDAPAGHRLTRLSVDSEPIGGDSAGVTGVIGASEDGSYVYFVATGQLVAGLPDESASRLYLWHTGTVSQVGKLKGGDEDELIPASRWDVGKWSRLTPDGKHLIFISQGSDELTGYDHGDSCGFGRRSPCLEVYLYDATANGGAGKLSCASCDPTGTPATTEALFVNRFAPGASGRTTYLSHAITDDGRSVFFTSGDALVPRDTNGVNDAYEYDSQTEEIHLLSSGTDPAPSFFMDASPNGHDAFIITRAPLVGADKDRLQDLYDVRVEGGFPEPPPPPAPCQGESCRGTATQPPTPSTPGSATAAGPGNKHPKHPKHPRKHRHKRHRHSTRRHG